MMLHTKYQGFRPCILWLQTRLIHVFPEKAYVKTVLYPNPCYNRTLVKSVYQKIKFLIAQPKHMLWVLKRTVLMRLFF